MQKATPFCTEGATAHSKLTFRVEYTIPFFVRECSFVNDVTQTLYLPPSIFEIIKVFAKRCVSITSIPTPAQALFWPVCYSFPPQLFLGNKQSTIKCGLN